MSVGPARMTAGLRARLRRVLDPARYRDVLGEGAPWPPAGSRRADRAAQIRHAAWVARRARFGPFLRVLVAVGQAAGWPVMTLRPARILAQRGGRGWSGAFALWRSAMRSGMTPLEQFAYRVPADRPAEANRWFLHAEFCHLNRALASTAARALCDDKVAFARLAAERGVPVPATLAVVQPGAPGDIGDALAAACDGVVLKPVTAFRAQGLEAWVPREEGRWQRASGAALTLERKALGARVADLATRHGAMLLQPMVPAHPALARADLVLPPVLRMITGRAPEGAVTLAYATLWYSLVPEGAERVMGITVIDPGSGRPITTQIQQEPHFDWLAPVAGLDLPDAPLPFWEAAVGAVSAAHRMLDCDVPVVAWDVVISPSGPVVLEGNIGTSIYYQQTVTGIPGSESALGPVVEAWLHRRGG